jgi:hypothetical protein
MNPASVIAPGTVPAQYAFASHQHPGDAPATLVFARAVIVPLGFTMLMVMIVATAGVLLGIDPIGWVIVAAPLAVAGAAAFTAFWMRRTPAELLLLGDRAAVRSVWEVSTGAPGVAGRLLPPKKLQGGIDVGIGEDVLTLTPAEWPRLAEIEAALNELVPVISSDTR